MAIFKCKMCGAQLEVKQGSKISTCQFCGSMQTIPDTDDEQKIALYNRANLLRLRSDFDKAIVTYQTIVNSYPKEAEAHWGLCLSKYGIEYVDDPRTGDKVPTCHRTLYESILEDPDYLEAVENADAVSKGLYQEEAKEIDRIQKRIIRISQKEEPYEVFICYKETDEVGNRTVDSVFAQDIYDKLTEKGYKVFFARITLENKLGQEYEPIIFAALRSAKVMLVVGTKQEYFEAVWVKNEWSRFLSFMQDDKDKYLIPCYRDMDAYDMPDEFQPLQAQDMSKIGYVQDLARGIDKLFGRDEKRVVQVVESVSSNKKRDGQYSRIEKAIEKGDFEKADWLIEDILAEDDKDARSYYYKYFVENEISDLHCFDLATTSPEGDDNFDLAYKYADEAFKDELDYILKNINENRMMEKYSKGKAAKSNADYARAIAIFTDLGGYKDSEEQIEDCNRLEEEARLAQEKQTKASTLESKFKLAIDKKAAFYKAINDRKKEIALSSSLNRKRNANKKIATIMTIVSLILVFLVGGGIIAAGAVSYAEDLMDSQLGSLIAMCVFIFLHLLFSALSLLGILKGFKATAFGVFNFIIDAGFFIDAMVMGSQAEPGEAPMIAIFGLGATFIFFFVACDVVFIVFYNKYLLYENNDERLIRAKKEKATADIQKYTEEIEQVDQTLNQISDEYYELTGNRLRVEGKTSSRPGVSASYRNGQTTYHSTSGSSSYTSHYSYGGGSNAGSKVMGILNGIFGSVASGFAAIGSIIVLAIGYGPIGYAVFLMILFIVLFIVFIVLSNKRPAPGIGFSFALVSFVLTLIMVIVISSSYYFEVEAVFYIFSVVFFAISSLLGFIRIFLNRR